MFLKGEGEVGNLPTSPSPFALLYNNAVDITYPRPLEVQKPIIYTAKLIMYYNVNGKQLKYY